MKDHILIKKQFQIVITPAFFNEKKPTIFLDEIGNDEHVKKLLIFRSF